jgi:hypothetical protein
MRDQASCHLLIAGTNQQDNFHLIVQLQQPGY